MRSVTRCYFELTMPYAPKHHSTQKYQSARITFWLYSESASANEFLCLATSVFNVDPD